VILFIEKSTNEIVDFPAMFDPHLAAGGKYVPAGGDRRGQGVV
jgi:hypothetical protein